MILNSCWLSRCHYCAAAHCHTGLVLCSTMSSYWFVSFEFGFNWIQNFSLLLSSIYSWTCWCFCLDIPWESFMSHFEVQHIRFEKSVAANCHWCLLLLSPLVHEASFHLPSYRLMALMAPVSLLQLVVFRFPWHSQISCKLW